MVFIGKTPLYVHERTEWSHLFLGQGHPRPTQRLESLQSTTYDSVFIVLFERVQ